MWHIQLVKQDWRYQKFFWLLCDIVGWLIPHLFLFFNCSGLPLVLLPLFEDAACFVLCCAFLPYESPQCMVVVSLNLSSLMHFLTRLRATSFLRMLYVHSSQLDLLTLCCFLCRLMQNVAPLLTQSLLSVAVLHFAQEGTQGVPSLSFLPLPQSRLFYMQRISYRDLSTLLQSS